MRVRRAVRRSLAAARPRLVEPAVLVALSGGADSLALAAAVAAEASPAGLRAGAVIVDHGLQPGSDEVAERAAAAARTLGLDPVVIRKVAVGGGGGPEAAAREARYAAFAATAAETGAAAVLTGHTRDDQAEQVLLALARGSGARSIAGIPAVRSLTGDILMLRPLLDETAGVTRAATKEACRECGLAPWHDPHNTDPAYARVRVRRRLLPALAAELGPGVAVGLARSADLAREDAEALDAWAEQVIANLPGVTPGSDRGNEVTATVEATLSQEDMRVLVDLPAAVRQRVIHGVVRRLTGESLSRDQVLTVASVLTDWRGQGPVFVPGLRVSRDRGGLRFDRQLGSPRAHKRPRAES